MLIARSHICLYVHMCEQVTSNHIVLCYGSRLQLLDFKGSKVCLSLYYNCSKYESVLNTARQAPLNSLESFAYDISECHIEANGSTPLLASNVACVIAYTTLSTRAAHNCLCSSCICMTNCSAKVREWVLEAPVTYLKVMGGPPGSELLLTGLANGSVLQVAA
jgi:hypothetical protein